MGNIDRRILYLIAMLFMAAPLFFAVPLPVAESVQSDNFYKEIERVNQKDGKGVIILCSNFSIDTRGESLPQIKAIVRHLLTNGRKFAIWSFNGNTAPGAEMTNDAAMQMAKELESQGIHRTYGKDWVDLGYRVATAPVMAGVSKDFQGFFKQEVVNHKPISQVPFMSNVRTAPDIGLVIDVSPSATYLSLIPAMTGKYGVPLIAAPTSVMVPDTYPFLKNGQIRGELRGVLGAAEYESLTKHRDLGTKEMTSVAAVDGLIIILIIIGNFSYFSSRRAGRENA
jgi:hypothetical protein